MAMIDVLYQLWLAKIKEKIHMSSYRVSTISFKFGQKKSKYTVNPM